MKRKQGWYRKAKIKFIENQVDNYELVKRGIFGSDRVRERNGKNIRSTWFGCVESDFQKDICNITGFGKRFIWAQNLARLQPEDFYFDYEMKRDFKY